MEQAIAQFLHIWKPLGYLFVFIGMLFEGDIILFTAAFLTHQGLFDFWDMLVVVASGVFLGDFLWYLLGVRLAKFRWIRKLSDRIASPFDSHLLEWPRRTLFLAKFTYGIGHLLLTRAGLLGLPAKKFFKADSTAIAAWIFVVGGLGYLSSASFEVAYHSLRYVGIGILALWVLFFIIGERIISRILRRRL